MLRLLAQRASVTQNEPCAPENGDARMTDRKAAPLWDFSKIPILSSGPAERFQVPPRFPAPGLPSPIQAKLKVGAVNDPLEHEADRVAQEVMRMPAPEVALASAPPQISPKCVACEEEGKLQKRPAGPQAAPGDAPAIVQEVLRSPGQPLDPATRAYFEPRFMRDFSEVRVHIGTSAERSARDVNANAYTSGYNIVFGAGRFAPATHEGLFLIAHELTHVIQQKNSHLHIQLDRRDPAIEQVNFEKDTLRELHRLPAVEERGISDPERKRRIEVLAARVQRLITLFSALSSTTADAIYERLRERRAGDVLSERFHDILATPTRNGLLQIIGRRLDVDPIAQLLLVPPHEAADFCRPFSRREIDQGLDFDIANAMDRFVNGDLRDFFGDEAADLYDTYLTSTEKNVSPKIFDDPKSELVQSFINHPATAKRQRELAVIIEKNLPDNCGVPPANEWVDFYPIIPREELKAGFSFFPPDTIPGITAGGISSGGGVIESRTLALARSHQHPSGLASLLRSEVGGRTTGLRLQVQFHFVVRDAIDFCPGNRGNILAQYITIPLSRLEASGMAFPVPFEVHYDGPILEVNLGPAAINACSPTPPSRP
jgi:hypothetical protein